MSTARAWTLASGIGALDLGLERAGWEIAGQCEIDPWCRRVLERHWPGLPRWGDMKEVDPADVLATCGPVDLVAGGPPCQPISAAGKGLAQADERWLWPEVVRLVGGLRPRYVLLENPPPILGRGFGDILGSLAEIGYDAEWTCIGAADVGAPHLRDRVWLVAHPGREPRHGREDLDPRHGVARGDALHGGRTEAAAQPFSGGEDAADASSGGRRATQRDLHGRESDPDRRGTRALADTNGEGQLQPGRGECDERGRPRNRGRRGRPLADADLPGRHGPLSASEAVGRPGTPRRVEPRRPGAGRAGGQTGAAQPRVGRMLDGLAPRLDGHRWPAPPDPANGSPQYDWEPPRTVAARQVPDRARRVSACGNALLPQIAELIGAAILADLHAMEGAA